MIEGKASFWLKRLSKTLQPQETPWMFATTVTTTTTITTTTLTTATTTSAL